MKVTSRIFLAVIFIAWMGSATYFANVRCLLANGPVYELKVTNSGYFIRTDRRKPIYKEVPPELFNRIQEAHSYVGICIFGGLIVFALSIGFIGVLENWHVPSVVRWKHFHHLENKT